MMVRIVEHADSAAQAEALAALVAADAAAAIKADGAAAVAAPGGSTPKAFLEALGRQDLDWGAITLMATDERWAPPTDPRSNEAMIRAALDLEDRLAYLPFWREGASSPEDAAPRLSEAVAPHLPLASAVIGMGEDMHCASLFPGGDGLAPAMAPGAPAVAATRPSGGLEPRVTLTAPVLAGADRLRLLISGAAKRAALEAALAEPDPAKAPVGAVLRAAGSGAHGAEVHWAP